MLLTPEPVFDVLCPLPNKARSLVKTFQRSLLCSRYSDLVGHSKYSSSDDNNIDRCCVHYSPTAVTAAPSWRGLEGVLEGTVHTVMPVPLAQRTPLTGVHHAAVLARYGS